MGVIYGGMQMKDSLLKIISFYGVNHQQRKLQEEVFELNEAIFKYEHDEYKHYPEVEKSLKEHITEELGDVTLMLKQFQEHYEITDEDIEKVMIFKGKRQLKRMVEEDERIN